jgi:NhaP-type Na+/H+ or K+/H+ antiporter
MLKLQPDTKNKTKIAGESLFNRGFALVVFITSIKISSTRRYF